MTRRKEDTMSQQEPEDEEESFAERVDRIIARERRGLDRLAE